MNENQAAIGFLDSGVGGLTVVREAMRQLPNERIIYIGDTSRCPYGPRPAKQIKQFTWELTDFLIKKQIKMLVVACNTATAVVLKELKAILDIPVIGVILPGSRAAVKATENQRIGVIGTLATIESGAYVHALKKKVPELMVESLACPRFVPIVESNEFQSPIAKKVVAETLKEMKQRKIDTLIMGCTHYPLLRPIIQNFMGQEVTLIDSGAETVSEVSMLLDYFELQAPPKMKKQILQHEFYTTGSPIMFEQIANEWLELENLDVRKAVVGKG